MGQCISFFKSKADANEDGKFDMKDVELIGARVYGVLQKGVEIVKFLTPFLELEGVDVTELNEVLTIFNDSLLLSENLIKQLGTLKIPKSLADLESVVDVNQDGKRDINDVIAYAVMTRATIDKAVRLCTDTHQDATKLQASSVRIQAVIDVLNQIKQHLDEVPAAQKIASH